MFEAKRRIIENLARAQCRCGRGKQPGQTFCPACWSQLSPKTRRGLRPRRRRFHRDYAPALAAALNCLTGPKA